MRALAVGTVLSRRRGSRWELSESQRCSLCAGRRQGGCGCLWERPRASWASREVCFGAFPAAMHQVAGGLSCLRFNQPEPHHLSPTQVLIVSVIYVQSSPSHILLSQNYAGSQQRCQSWVVSFMFTLEPLIRSISVRCHEPATLLCYGPFRFTAWNTAGKLLRFQSFVFSFIWYPIEKRCQNRRKHCFPPFLLTGFFFFGDIITIYKIYHFGVQFGGF